MTVQLNGEPYRTNAQTLEQLLKELGLESVGIAIAVNGAVVRRAAHGNHTIHSNDSIEIIRAVQGG